VTNAKGRLCVYNGGILMQRPARRILELAGWNVGTGVPEDGDHVGVWGQSPTAWRGEAVAGWSDAPVVTVEDAFLRSVLPGRIRDEVPVGLSIDTTGVHFDGSAASDLETLLRTSPLDDTPLLNRARASIEQLKYWHLGKYSGYDPSLDVPDPGYVVVIDQTRDDTALQGAGRNEFAEMLMVAADENPASDILIKAHPESVAGARPGHYDGNLGIDRARLLTEPVSPWTLFEGAVAVYTHSSTLGFEAIFAGHKPRVFGLPFYAGWGRTLDAVPAARRGRELTRAQLFAGAMILYPTWYDPASDRLCEVEDVIAALAARARAWREDRAGYVGTGIRRWKRPLFKRAFGSVTPMIFANSPRAASRKASKSGRKIIAWGTSDAPDGALRVEDGFLRSRGLGAALVAPVSLSIDRNGNYFDPSKPTDLDSLITSSVSLPEAEIERARRLLDRILAVGLTKYFMNDEPAPLADGPVNVLVVGQVEDDASVLLGAGKVRTNLDLLRAARAARPNARILWKPHPDVEAGLREGAISTADLEGLADVELANISPHAAIDLANELWTITSTMGFEALIRGKSVTCTGMPFYAGWGLTNDHVAQPAHRGSGPEVIGLAHAALIGYPRYFDPERGDPFSPEQAVDYLVRMKDAPAQTSRLSLLQQLMKRTVGLRP
jgi:capsular polysaccharide export protein